MDFTPGERRRSPLQDRAYEILEVAHQGDWASRWFDRFLIGLISLNVLARILRRPCGILAASFLEQSELHRRDQVRTCPHCGEEIGDCGLLP